MYGKVGRHPLHLQTYVKCMNYLEAREVTKADILNAYTTARIRKMIVGYRHEQGIKRELVWYCQALSDDTNCA